MNEKQPLICAGCGRVMGWARRANGHEQKCKACGRTTVFTIRAGRVEKCLAPERKVKEPRVRTRIRKGPPGRRELEAMMMGGCYVDYWKC